MFQDPVRILLQEDRPIPFRSTLKKISGSYCAALMLAQLMYWSPRAGAPWIYKTDAELGAEICASNEELHTARGRLVKLGLIKTKRKGLPAKMHYQVCFPAVEQAIRKAYVSPVTGDAGNYNPASPGTCDRDPLDHTYTEMSTEMSLVHVDGVVIALPVQEAQPDQPAQPARPSTAQQKMVGVLMNVTGGTNPKRFARAASDLLVAGLDPDTVNREYSPGGWWYLKDWRGKKGQRPAVSQICDTAGSLKAVATPADPRFTPEATAERNERLMKEWGLT